MDVLLVSAIFVLGLAIGAPASMIGLAGGFLIVPTMILIFQLPAQNAVAISLVAITGTAVSAALGYMRQKKVNFKLGLLYNVLDVPGVVLGVFFSTLISSSILTVLCGLFLAIVSFMLMRRSVFPGENEKSKQCAPSSQKSQYPTPPLFWILISSLFGGFITGLAGLGGGITDTSTMLLLGVSPYTAVASSEFAMALTNGVGVLSHGFLHNVLWEYALPLTVGTVFGAQVGCALNRRVKVDYIRKVIVIITFIVGIRLILSMFI